MEQSVAERPFSQEQQINQQQIWRDGTVGPSDAKFQEGPSQSWCPRNQTGWGRTHMQPSGGYGRDNQTQDTGRIPVCWSFFRGRCFRGTSCRYQHCEFGRRDGLRFVLCNDFLKGICTVRSTRGIFAAENSMNFSPMSGSEKTGLAVSGDEIGDCIGTLSNGHQIRDQQTPINAFSIGQGLNLGIINQYGQLMGEYSKLDDELWFSKSEDDEAVTGFDVGPQWNCISAGYVSKYKS